MAPHQQQQLRPPLHHPQHRQRGQPPTVHDERHGGGELCPGCGTRGWGSALGLDASHGRRHDQGQQLPLPPPALSGATAAASVAAAAAAAAGRQHTSYADNCIALPQQQLVPTVDWRQCAERLAAERRQQQQRHFMQPQQQLQHGQHGMTHSASYTQLLDDVARIQGATSAAGARQAPAPAPTPLQAMLADKSFVSRLLASLPGVDAAAPVIQQAVAGLRQKRVVVMNCCGCGACSASDYAL